MSSRGHRHTAMLRAELPPQHYELEVPIPPASRHILSGASVICNNKTILANDKPETHFPSKYRPHCSS